MKKKIAAAAFAASMSLALGATSASASHAPATKDDCKNGGYKTTSSTGQAYKNEGQCVSTFTTRRPRVVSAPPDSCHEEQQERPAARAGRFRVLNLPRQVVATCSGYVASVAS